MIRRILLMTLLAIAATSAKAQAVFRINVSQKLAEPSVINRTLKIEVSDAISMQGVKPILFANPNEISVIEILIDSHGGQLLIANRYMDAVNAAKARGIIVKCVVSGVAASGAFALLNVCSERYAFPNSLLLFHGVQSTSQQTSNQQDLENNVEQHRMLNTKFLETFRKDLDMDDEVFYHAVYTDKLWFPETLNAACNHNKGKEYVKIIKDFSEMYKK